MTPKPPPPLHAEVTKLPRECPHCKRSSRFVLIYGSPNVARCKECEKIVAEFKDNTNGQDSGSAVTGRRDD